MGKQIIFLITVLMLLIAAGNSYADLNEGLVACYPFNGNADDNSENDNHGTVYGAALTEDRFGNIHSAYSFDGIDDYIDIGSDSTLKMNDAITISAWIKIESIPLSERYYNIVSDHAEPCSNAGKVLRIDNNGIEFLLGCEGTSEVRFLLTNDLSNQWIQLAATYNGNVMQLYINGNLVDTESRSGSITVNNLPVWIARSGYGEFFLGSIDDIRIYNRALTEEEVGSLYNEKRIDLTIPESATEGDGILSNQGLITITPVSNTDVEVFLTSNDTSEITIPESVIIPSGSSSASFDIIVEDDADLDSSQIASLSATAQYHIPGSANIEVRDNETLLSKNNSPYYISSNIYVEDLTIEPGVRVEFLGNYAFEIVGTLVALGTADEPIIFVPSAENTDGWQGIYFNNSNDESRLEHVKIEGSINSGIRIVNSLPAISNCTISNNQAAQGGGLNIDLTSLDQSSELVINRCAISDNTSTGHGGGIRADLGSSVLRFESCTISSNISNPTKGNGNYVGGGFYYTGGDGQLVLVNSQVLDNISYSKCSSWGCSVTNRGGGVYSNGNLELTNSIIRGNLSWAIDNASGGSEHNYSYGGGIYHNAGSLTATNCIVSHNRGNPGGSHPYPYGGGIYVYSGTADITNCTIAYNERYGIYRNSGTVSAVNSIVYFNVVGQVAGTVDVTYSDIQDGFDGEGNINVNPVFKSESDLIIVPRSQCIDAGNPDPQYSDNCFPLSSGVETNDMGAHGGPLACNWDIDFDGILDGTDNCRQVYNPGQEDGDEDGYGDSCDECPEDPNKVIPGVDGCGNPEQANRVSGTIIDSTWSLAGSPYLVEGDIRVAGLVIEPGVRVEFLGNHVFEVAGTLTAVGISEDPIQFVPSAENTDGWQGIYFNNSNDESRLEHVKIEGSINSGIRIVNSLPAISNCTISNNQAAQGGGLNIDLTSLDQSSELVINRCAISDNTSTGHGGGIRADLGSSVLRFESCTISNNISNPTMGNGNYVGGGFYYTGGDGQLVLVNSQVLDNISYSKCSSWGCSVTNRGGGVYSNGNLELTNSILRGNLSWAIDNASGGSEHNYSYGGGIYHNAGSLTATNCIVSHNRGNPGGSHPYPYGGGIYVYSGTADITNCTIAYNERYGIYRNSGTVSAVNSIVYFNVVGQVAGTVDVTYSDIQDGFDGEGNISVNPVFKSESDLIIVPESQCIDAGNPDPQYSDNCFPLSSGVETNDMGAHGGPLACNWDIDFDGILDGTDNCRQVYNPGQEDGDEDGYGDSCDECPEDPNKVIPGVDGCGNPEQANRVSGTIIDSTWSLAGSPYLVEGDIRVAGLVIEPGVRVEFLGNHVFEVAGTLTAVGISEDPIQFVPSAENTDGWQGIYFNNSNDESRLEHVKIEGSINSGIRIVNSLPAISNCTISNNQAAQGGGLNIDLTSLDQSSELVINRCAISDNTSTGHGGGIRADLGSSVLRFESCTISNNISNPTMGNGNYVGGGFYYTGGDGQLVLVNSQVLDNISYSKCSSWGCSVTNRGGGVYSNGNLELTNSILRGNLSWAIDNASGGSEHNYSYGGGIYHNAGSLIATNCIISHNRGNPGGTNPYPYGGGIYVYSGTADITNCTIAYNERYGIYRNSGTVSAVNSIVYFNVVGQVAGTVDVTYSDVQDGFDGEGNIDGDPLFIDENNFHLLIGSPCFDTGTSEGAPQQDIEGNQRPQGYGYDMGAYEDILEADFSASITKGFAPLTVQFTNLSLGNSSEWQWDFDNDGVVDSTEKDPEWTYSDFGSYSVSLSIINGETSVSEIKENYITVTTIPEDITNLRIESFDDRVVLSWDHSINSEGDLDGYKVYFGEPAIITRLDANTNVFEINELPPASVYPVRVTAIDIDENESAGVTATAATLLSNPDSLTATPAGSMMDLVWNSVTTPDLVSQYAIYVSETDFTSVSGMTPKLRVDGTQTSTRLAGLEEDTLYYFAVTAINLSGNDLKTVTTVSATTESDPEGPEISDIRFNGELLTDGMTITVSGTLSLTATDISKISQVQFYDDANLLGHDQNGSSSYSMPWFIEPVADGTHTLTFTAYDTLDHSTTVTRTVNVTLAPPSAPVITSPATTTTTAESSLIVTGQSQVQNEIALLINGVDPDQWATVNSDGGFSIPVTLTEGENRIQAQARNRAGNSPLSAEIVVTLDTDQPQSPLHMAAESQEAGAIRLSWSRPLETAVAGYNIYRSATAFDSIATAEKINAEPVIGTLYIDLPDTDGTYYYGVTTKDLKDRESGLSTIVSAVSDRIMPAAVTIAYTPTGPYDPNSGRVGQGTVDVLLTVSEPLAAVPFFSLNPTGGSPMTLDMVKTADLTYAGTFDITADTPSGTAYAVFSGRDMAGNRGTEIQEGTSLLIDTQGPQIIDISLVPASPVRNDADNPVSITATIGLDEALKSDTVPELTCRLSGHGDTVFAVDTISQVDTIAGHAQTWQAVLTLSADAGEAQAETLRFVYNGLDDLGNAGGSISAANQFQIYQDDLPPLDAPTGLSAQSLAGGQIALTWDPVDGAAAYALYRQAPGESGLTLLTEIEGETAYTDAPALEGVYLYAVASIRRANDQETVSGLSDALTAVSDATAPAAPSDLTLALTAQGIVAEWADNATEPVTFSLFRSDQSSIPSVDGLTPVMTGTLETRAVDAYPQSTFHCYTVVAVDSAGNVSEPAPSMLLDFDLLPVSGLSERQEDEDPPVVTWSHADATVTGYDFYLGPEAAAVKINTDPMTVTTFTDTGYNGDERHYGVVALGDAGQESLQRRITLPLLQASLDENAVLLRRTANRLDYIVENRSTADIDNVTLVLQIEGAVYRSDPFDVAASSTANVSMIVVGGQDWPDPISLTTTLEIIPNEGELIEIVRSGDVTVQDSSQVLRILAGNLLRGGSSEVRFTLENTGAEIVEILTAVNSGSQASSDIGLKLLDTDGNVLSTATYRQNLGNDIVTLADGRSIARIPAGGTFESAAMTLAVPENAPDAVTLQLDISAVYMNLGKSDQQTLPGISTTQAAALIDTSYYGQVETVSPESSHGDEDILISGRALARATDEPLANVPLDLVISVQGFDRTYRIYTDANGQFSYAFTPMAGEYGDYTVWARHPELNDTAPQAGFEIVRLVYQIPETPVRGVNFVKPATFNIGIPRNYVLDVPITVVAGGEAMHNVRVEYNTVDQPDGQLLAGVHVQTGDVLATIDQGHSAVLHWTLWADNTAADTGSLILSVKSDENGEASWQTITVNLQFSEARPVLYFSPDHIETGMALDDTVTETITFNNNGFADMENVQLSLVDESGAPAPDWIALNTASDFGDLLMDESREIGIFFSPTADKVNEGLYTYYLRVSADNYPDTDILLFAAVTQSGIGNALIKVSDIYTGTEDPNTGETIQGLANASITLQNEVVLTETFSAATNSQGEALINDLPAGRYKCRVRASNHQEYIGRTWIKPGITTTKEVFLANNLVTVEWKVVPTTIQDKYEVVLTATYETNVPAAVLVAEPASVMLPDMQAGDVFRAEFTLTNYGLIRAQDLSLVMPEDNEYYRYELMSGLPDYLDAKEQITVSYRVVCTKSPDEDGSGGGCWPVSWDINIYCRWVCINGKWVVARIPYLIIKYECDDDDTGYEFGTSPPPVVSTPTWPDFGGSGDYSIDYDWGSFSDFTFNADEIDDENNDCIDPPPNQDPCYDPDQQCVEKETEQNKCEPTGSSVNTLMRDYQRRDIDFFIKVPGGTLDVERYYYNGKWYLSPVMTSLMFEYVEGDITVISKDGLAYLYRGVDLWTLSARKWIKKTVDGYLWESKTGRWRSYDDTGRQIAFGDRNGTIGTFIYNAGGDTITGIQDRNGIQVIWFETDIDGRITAAQDGESRRVTYTYTNGLLTDVEDVLGNNTRYGYDQSGRLSQVTDVLDRTHTIEYTGVGHVTSVTDQNNIGRSFSYNYDRGTLQYYTSIDLPSGAIKEVWYDQYGDTQRVDINGRTIQRIEKQGRDLLVYDAAGNETRKSYDEWDNLLQMVYPDGATITYEYDFDHHQVTRKTDERGIVTEYEYDANGNRTLMVEAVGTSDERITEWEYDVDGNLLIERQVGDADTAEAVTQMTYDAAGNMLSKTDPENHTTHYTYDIMGNLRTMEDPRGNTWEYVYDGRGQLREVIDSLTHTTHYEYDASGNKVKEVDAEGLEIQYEYDDHNNLIRSTAIADPDDPSENVVTIYEYNDNDQLIRRIDPEGKIVVRNEYDDMGRKSKTIDGNDNEIIFEYDDSSDTGCASCNGGSVDQPVRIIYPTFSKQFAYNSRGWKVEERDVLDESTAYTTFFDYDVAGNLIRVTDKMGNPTSYDFDSFDRQIRVTDALSHDTNYTFDNRNNLIALQDANGNTTRLEYDRNNRLVKEIRPMGEETQYVYDTMGNLITKIDAKNQKVSYIHDAANRMIEVHYFTNVGDAAPEKTTFFIYDDIGNLTGYDDGTTKGRYVYDLFHRKKSEIVDYGLFQLLHSYTYYRNGLKESFTGPDGITYAYSYDANNQLAQIQIPGIGSIAINEKEWNRPLSMTYPGGQTIDYKYDPLMRVSKIESKDLANNIIMAYLYSYDHMSNIIQKATEHGAYNYEYDNLYQLTRADNPLIDNEVYSYDAVGNRKTELGAENEWQYNSNNELIDYNGVVLDYDSNGNTIRRSGDDQVINYHYNIENRLIRIEDINASLIPTYYYDPFGRRLWKQIGEKIIFFHYSDEGLVGEFDQNSALLKSFGYVPGSIWNTYPMFLVTEGNYYWFNNDHIGTPQYIIDLNGSTVWRSSKNSFGKDIMGDDANDIDRLGFSGQYKDVESKLYYNLNRFYDPSIGRFISADPLGVEEEVNPYFYVRNNPLIRIDPLGLKEKEISIGNRQFEGWWFTGEKEYGKWTDGTPPGWPNPDGLYCSLYKWCKRRVYYRMRSAILETNDILNNIGPCGQAKVSHWIDFLMLAYNALIDVDEYANPRKIRFVKWVEPAKYRRSFLRKKWQTARTASSNHCSSFDNFPPSIIYE